MLRVRTGTTLRVRDPTLLMTEEGVGARKETATSGKTISERADSANLRVRTGTASRIRNCTSGTLAALFEVASPKRALAARAAAQAG